MKDTYYYNFEVDVNRATKVDLLHTWAFQTCTCLLQGMHSPNPRTRSDARVPGFRLNKYHSSAMSAKVRVQMYAPEGCRPHLFELEQQLRVLHAGVVRDGGERRAWVQHLAHLLPRRCLLHLHICLA